MLKIQLCTSESEIKSNWKSKSLFDKHVKFNNWTLITFLTFLTVNFSQPIVFVTTWTLRRVKMSEQNLEC